MYRFFMGLTRLLSFFHNSLGSSGSTAHTFAKNRSALTIYTEPMPIARATGLASVAGIIRKISAQGQSKVFTSKNINLLLRK